MLVKVLDDKDAENRRGAAFVLGQLGGRARDALPALRKAQKDASPEVRQAADNAVKAIEK